MLRYCILNFGSAFKAGLRSWWAHAQRRSWWAHAHLPQQLLSSLQQHTSNNDNKVGCISDFVLLRLRGHRDKLGGRMNHLQVPS